MADFHVLSLGAGVQSTALYLMFMRGEIQPQIDAAVFADTGEEPAAVYRHLEWLQSLGGPKIMVRSVGRLGEDLIHGRVRPSDSKMSQRSRRFASIPAFTTADHGKTVGITRRQCSKEYKTEVISRAIRREILGLQPRQRIPRNSHVARYMGISLDEAGRARRITEIFKKENRAFTPKFPLIERYMTRANCIAYLADKVPHETPRSACVFCPYHSDYEWDQLKVNDPEGFLRAVEIDHALRAVEIDHALRADGTVAARAMNQVMYLHRSCKPLELVQLDTRPDPRKAQLAINFSVECEGMCGI